MPLPAFRRHHRPDDRIAAEMAAVARATAEEALAAVGSAPTGLPAAEAVARLAHDGPNVVTSRRRTPLPRILGRAILNPLVLLLATLAVSSAATGDAVSAALMLVMIVIGVGLRFVQESRAAATTAALEALVAVHATVVRDGVAGELPVAEIVRGDVVRLAAGDMIPADVRLVRAKDLFVSQASLTGESFPVEKSAGPAAGGAAPLDLACVCWLGTSVESGSGDAVVVATGPRTFLGSVSAGLDAPPPPTAFDRGVARFTWLMVGFVAVMVPVVFVLNGLSKGDWPGALIFALAVAVGLTPEMLPMIVAVSLARGAMAMARQRVIVRRLDSIQNLGAMDVLCADKTGTLTLDRIILERHCDVALREDSEVLALAWLNSHFQTGLKSLLDRAILDHEELQGPAAADGWTKLDEIPFDFSRRVMSVVVAAPDGRTRLVAKGAPEAIFTRATAYAADGDVLPLGPDDIRRLTAAHESLSADGFRVLAVATRELPRREAYSREDERDLVLRGYVAFLDPPKDSAAAAIRALAAEGVAVKVLTGDNELVARRICGQVGIDTAHCLTGAEVEQLDDERLAAAAARATLMARLTPVHKERIVTALRRHGHVVGFMGDGINDAPALRAADVGISVDSAVDIARSSADCILLAKDLRVLEAGVREGRRVFVNILKYVRMGASSNFGNMLSMLVASVALPFVPMTPLEILANNLLYDCSQVPIPNDEVDPELVARPRPWSMPQISRFILLVGPVSSIFDLATWAILVAWFGCGDPARAAVFQTGWFVESLLTQTLVIHVIRTERIPFVGSRASPALMATTAVVAAAGVWLVHSPLAAVFGFAPLPAGFWPVLAVIVVGYLTATHAAKSWLVRRGWID